MNKINIQMLRIKRWFAPPVFPGDELKTHRASLINVALLAMIAFALLVLFRNTLVTKTSIFILGIDIVTLVLLTALWVAMRAGHLSLASTGLVMLGMIVTTVIIANLGTIRTPITATFLVFIISASLLFEMPGIIATTVLSSLLVLGLLYAENMGLLPHADFSVTLAQWTNYTALFTLAGILSFLGLHATRQALTRADHELAERKHMEDQLRQLSRAVEQSPSSIVITDIAGQIEYVNPKFTQVTGYTLAEALGNNPRILKSGEMSPAGYRQMWETLLAGKEWHGEFHNKKKNGELYWEMASISPITDSAGHVTHYVAVKEDITARKQAEVQLTFVSTHDTLTGIYNRAFFETEIARLSPSREFPISILVADLDNLKVTNDAHGHAVGDELIKRAAHVLQSVFRASDILARIGGDEFALLLPKTDTHAAEQILARIRDNLAKLNTEHSAQSLSLSLGLATALEGDLTETFKLADARMYADKRARKESHGENL